MRSTSMNSAWTKPRIYTLSRALTAFFVLSGVGTLFLAPEGPLAITLDILFRSHVMFLCTVMAHESSHGQMGRSKAANLWWGRLALIMPMVPAVNFRKTHRLHHAHTNVEGDDPDQWVKPKKHWIEMPLRSVALPHYWLVWLHKRGKLTRADLVELGLWYVTLAVVYGAVFVVMGPERLAMGMIPPLLVVSLLLWYPFAVKTHEGFSTGAPETRSHNYYGKWVYWFTLGLSMHRAHHLYPTLSWLELYPYVEEAPLPWWRRMLFPRDIVKSGA